MLPSFLLLPLSVIPVIVPPRAQLGEIIMPSSYVQVAKVPLPQLSSQQWEMLRQQQGADRKPLRLHVALSVYQGHVYGVHVLRGGIGYPGIDSTIVNWIAANWKTPSWFGVGTENAVSFDVDPTLRQVRFQTEAA